MYFDEMKIHVQIRSPAAQQMGRYSSAWLSSSSSDGAKGVLARKRVKNERELAGWKVGT
jgi:hypothetical protein